MERLKNFAENTTIHGIKDFLRIDYVWARWLWALFVGSCLGMMIHEIYQLLAQYAEDMTATQVRQQYFAEYKYPRILFCPKDWINESKVAEMEISKPMLVYALSLLQRIRLRPEDKELAAGNVTEMHEEFDQFLIDNGIKDYIEFYKTIADNEEMVSKCHQCEPTEKQVLASGVCIRFKPYPATSDLMIQLPPRFRYTEITGDPELKKLVPSYMGAYASDVMYVSFKMENDFFAYDPILLNRNTSYVLRVKPTFYKRFNGRQSCVTPNEMDLTSYSQLMCYFKCDEKFRSKCLGCRYLSIERNQIMALTNWTNETVVQTNHDEIDGLPFCTSLIYDPVYNRSCSLVDGLEFHKCANNCAPLCEEWVYETTVIPIAQRSLVGTSEGADITVMLSYQVRYGETFIEEVQTYTWETFVSNIGGQLGLWMGASVVSLLQLIHFLAELCFYDLNACRLWKKLRGASVDVNANGQAPDDHQMSSSVFTTPSGVYNWSFQSAFDERPTQQHQMVNGGRSQASIANGNHWNGVTNGALYY